MKKSLVYARNVSIAIVALIVVAGGLGAVYVWWTGQQAPTPNAIAEPVDTTPVSNKIKRVKQAANAPVSASVQSITSPVSPGDNTDITVRSTQDTKCTIKVEYNEVASKDSGLVEKDTDEYGMVSWSWSVEPGAPYGEWPVLVTCARGDKTAVVKAELSLKSKAELSE